MTDPQALVLQAVRLIRSARRVTAFTGAGISVESGIPPFRGPDGLWSRYDPRLLDIGYFHARPKEVWEFLAEIFYRYFENAKPNRAHAALAEMEKKGFCSAVITQNIDNLHREAGTKTLYEFHGNSKTLLCERCGVKTPALPETLKSIPPLCRACGRVLKPDFVFFGESIPEPALSRSFAEAEQSDLFILIGTTGTVQPAAQIPLLVKRNKGRIIEVNPEESNYTDSCADLFLKGGACSVMDAIGKGLFGERAE